MRNCIMEISSRFTGMERKAGDRTIWVKFNKPAKKDFTVTISTEKFDLIGMAED